MLQGQPQTAARGIGYAKVHGENVARLVHDFLNLRLASLSHNHP